MKEPLILSPITSIASARAKPSKKKLPPKIDITDLVNVKIKEFGEGGGPSQTIMGKIW